MFKWLEEELAAVNTPRFFLVDGRMPDDEAELVRSAKVALPPSYRRFVMRFGNAKLFRQGSIYLVQVFAAPREASLRDQEPLLLFGRAELAYAYFKESLLVPGAESPVFEWSGGRGLRRTAAGFEEWLLKRCRAARKRFKKTEWAGIIEGPEPFTPLEEAIVAARRRFRWCAVGIAPNGDIQFEVHNGSRMVLPYLTVGIRCKGGDVIGAAYLPVGHLRPGVTSVVEKGCYKKGNDPRDIEPFDMPDPEPALRDLYWEFHA